MTARHSQMQAKARRSRFMVALARPELRYAGDCFERKAPASPTSAPVKVQDLETQKLIAEALAKRGMR